MVDVDTMDLNDVYYDAMATRDGHRHLKKSTTMVN